MKMTDKTLILSFSMVLSGVCLCAATASCQAHTGDGNPCFQGPYADPEGIVYDGTVFVYPTRSLPF